MLKPLSNYYHCQAILLDQQTISAIGGRGLGSIQAKRLCSAAEDWHYSWLFALWSSRLCHITQWASDWHWWYEGPLSCHAPVMSTTLSLILSNSVIYDNSCNSFSYICHTSPIFSDHLTTFSISGNHALVFTFVVPFIAFDISTYNLFSYVHNFMGMPW